MKQTVMDVVFLAAVLLLDEEDDIREKYNQVERVWVKPILRKRKEFGAFHTLFKELLTQQHSQIQTNQYHLVDKYSFIRYTNERIHQARRNAI